MKKTLLYFREIGSGLDSGMTLQIMNDYGHLSNMGHTVVVPVFCSNPADQSTLENFIETNRFNNLNVLFSRLRLKKLRFVSIFLTFLALIKNTKPGCVLVLRERKHLFAAKLLKFFTGVPIISELHEGGLPCNENGKQHHRIQTLFNSVEGIIFTNFSQIQYFNEHGYAVPKTNVVLPNGVDTHKFSQAIPTPKDSPHFVVTYTGQFTSWKNIPLLFDSLRHLPSNFRLRIAGGKSRGEDSKSYIIGLEKEFGVEGRVEYLGFLHPNELISRAINNSSVLAVPLGENLTAKFATSPMKLVEYMATAIPIVAVAHPSVTHLTGENTVHLSPMDAKEFAAAIRAAVGEDAEMQQQRIHRTNLIAKQYDHLERAGKYDSWLMKLASSAP